MSATNIWSRSWRIFPWKPLNPGEALIAWGLLFYAAAAAWLHFVMGIIFAVPSAAIAMIFLTLGLIRARDKRKIDQRQLLGITLLILGIICITPAAFAGASLSYRLALESHHPQIAAKSPLAITDFIWFIAISIPPFICLSAGIERWTNWPPGHRKIWRLIFAAVPVAALIIHQILAARGAPLTA